MEANNSDKYYRQKRTVSWTDYRGSVIRNNPCFEVSVNDNVDMPDIDISIDNYEKKYFKRPTGSKYEKINEIDKDSFYNYFNISLDVLKSTTWNTAEYFLIKYTNSYKLIAFTEVPRLRLVASVMNDIDFMDISVGIKRSFSSRPGIRKSGITISEEIFCYVFKETINFIEDDCSYLINRKEFWDKISKAIKGELTPTADNKIQINYQQLIEHLDIKKKQIEQFLMDKDDTALKRATLRGEKDGINYAIKTIKNFFKLIDIK
jgi:hypothetical protein